MKLHLLSILACPLCGSDLAYDSLEDHPREEVEIESGGLSCAGCAAAFPISDGVPRLRPEDAVREESRGSRTPSGVAKTKESFGFEWHRYPGPRAEDRGLFLEETQLDENGLDGRLVLDAGCGMGRYTHVALSLGAEVVSFDLSDSLTRLIPEMRENPKLHVVQGDLLNPPLKPGVFDVIYSQGVIHHTADTRRAFDKIAALVKRDGLLSVWVYGTPGSWASFRTNPLKSSRGWLRSVLFFVWLVVWVRQLFSDFVRVFTTRLPVPVLYALCYPLTALGAVPILKYLTFSVEPEFQVRLIENFDWLAPPYQTKHTKEEFGAWFEENGYEVLSRLPHGVVPKIGAIGRRRSKAPAV
jgi:SAM-dependent methyltransferase